MSKVVSRRENVFDKITFATKGLEHSFVEMVSTWGPWASALTPASMTFQHVVNSLGFDPFFGWTTALTVEIVGLASGHTIVRFYMHNKKMRAKKDRIPIWPIAFVFVFYLVVIMTINVALDWGNQTTAQIIARICLVLLTVPSIVIVSLRAQHYNILMGTDELMKQMSFSITDDGDVTTTTSSHETSQPQESQVQEEVRRYLLENNLSASQFGRGKDYSPAQLAEVLGANQSSVRSALYRLNNGNGTG